MIGNPAGDRVAVIGGGIIGTMCGWFLTKAGYRVTIVDRDRLGAACSHGNCGYISPSHVLPLAQPGAIRKTIGALFHRDGALRIKPQWQPAFYRWFLNFARCCNHNDMMESATARYALLKSSMQLYESLIDEERIDCEWQRRGLIFVYDTPKEFEEFRKTSEMIEESFGITSIGYDAAALLQLEPALKGNVGGGWHFESDCHIRPDKLLTEMRQRLEQRGVTIVEQHSVDGFRPEQGKAKALIVEGQLIEADSFVIATGAVTPFFNRHLGCEIPIQPGKGYSLTMPTPRRMPRFPIIFESTHVAITPMETKYRIGSTMEFVGYDSSIDPERIAVLRRSAEKYLHDPYCDPIEEEWFGWRPMTWDGKPIIDRSPAYSNVWIAAGHNMLGMSMATATGRLITELVSGDSPHVDPKPYGVSRFH